jgi:hypothetical protein
MLGSDRRLGRPGAASVGTRKVKAGVSQPRYKDDHIHEGAEMVDHAFALARLVNANAPAAAAVTKRVA